MSGHTRWDPSRWKRSDDPSINELTAQFVQGYILAMEDVLRDIEAMHYDAEDADPEYLAGHGIALDSLKRQAEESRENARRTLDAITNTGKELNT